MTKTKNIQTFFGTKLEDGVQSFCLNYRNHTSKEKPTKQ